jgi:predicted transcriptional regulator
LVDNKVTLNDGHYVELEPKANGIVYHLYSPDKKLIRDIFDKNDPTQFGANSTIGQEIKKHSDPNKYGTKYANDELDKVRLKLAELVDEIRKEIHEAEKAAEEVEQYEKQQALNNGRMTLETTEHPLLWVANTIDWLTAGERMNILYSWIAYCSQIILENPISVIAIGEASSGKSHIIDTALDLLPQEYVIRMKSATMAATYALADEDPKYFDKKIVYIGDMGGQSDHEEAEAFKNLMKELQTDGEARRIKMVTGNDGEQVPKWFILEGYPCLTYTNVPGHEYDNQELSRSVMLSPRQDNDEAVSIFKHLNDMKRGRTFDNIEEYRNRIPMIRNMVLALKEKMNDVEIVNPYRQFIRDFLSKTKYFKRDFDKYNGILKIITVLNGYNRPVHDGFIFTTKEDIAIFLELLERYHESITSNLSPNAMDILGILRDKAEEWELYEEGITVNDFMYRANLNFAKSSIQRYFGEMNSSGILKVDRKEGNQNVYLLMDSGFLKEIKNIRLTSFDEKMLVYNFGISAEELDTIYPHTPSWGISESINPPVWNDFLPENRK